MREQPKTNNLLADFCSARAVLLVMITMALLAVVIVLLLGQEMIAFWVSLGMLTMFLQWVGLLSLATLCALSPLLKRMDIALSSVLVFVLIQLITLGVSEATYLLIRQYIAIMSIAPEQHGYFLMRNVVISMIISGVALRYMFLQRQLQIKIKVEDEAKIQILQARIRPHFLFNSMNSIATLTHVDADAAEKAILDLSEIYRATLNADDSMTTLADEIALTRHYLEIEKLRLHERLVVNWQIDESALLARLPSLIIQPLVENAVYYGIEPCVNGGIVHIQISRSDRLSILVSSPLPGKYDDMVKQGNQMAIGNIRERLKIVFGKQATLKSSQDGGKYHVMIEIPVRSLDE